LSSFEQPDPLDVWIAIDCVTNRKRIVTRYAEAVLDALIGNSLDDVINYRGRFCSHYLFLNFSKTDISENLRVLARISALQLLLSRDCVAGGS
jgi:hypothetical protein